MDAKTTYKIIVLVIAVVQLVLASVIQQAPLFSIGAVAIGVLGIVSAALTLIANYLPSLFGEAPAVNKP